MRQLRECVNALKIRLPPSALARVDALYERYRNAEVWHCDKAVRAEIVPRSCRDHAEMTPRLCRDDAEIASGRDEIAPMPSQAFHDPPWLDHKRFARDAHPARLPSWLRGKRAVAAAAAAAAVAVLVARAGRRG